MTTKVSMGSIAGARILALTGLALMLGTCTAQQDERDDPNVTPDVRSERISNHLPSKCRQYYNNGTDQWIDCMGVGPK